MCSDNVDDRQRDNLKYAVYNELVCIDSYFFLNFIRFESYFFHIKKVNLINLIRKSDPLV